MVGLRIQGLVRAVRLARADMRAGFDEAGREAFLKRVRRVVARADEILDDNGYMVEHLPAPSRTALSDLRAIAALRAAALAPAGPSQPVRKPVQLKNVVRTLDGCLERLAAGASDPAIARDVRLEAQVAADAIAGLCADAGSHTAGLAGPSKRAYAMLRWLSQPENMERYVEQVRFAVRKFPELWEQVSGITDPSAARVRFKPTGPLIRSGPPEDPRAWTLAIGCLAADEEDLRAILECVGLGGEASSQARARRAVFARSEAYGAVRLELDFLADPTPFQPRGRAYDLDVLYERLDRRFFRGALEKPHLHWRDTQSRRTFGLFIPALDLACLNPLLDDPAVPEFVAEAVLYHELLHKKHGMRLVGGRAHVHTPAFKAEERLHPRLAESDRWLVALAHGRSPPAEPQAPPEPRPVPAPPPPSVPRVLPNAQFARPPRPGRNAACWCGSGRKYKHCHLAADDRA